jgi:hypothetical protein
VRFQESLWLCRCWTAAETRREDCLECFLGGDAELHVAAQTSTRVSLFFFVDSRSKASNNLSLLSSTCLNDTGDILADPVDLFLIAAKSTKPCLLLESSLQVPHKTSIGSQSPLLVQRSTHFHCRQHHRLAWPQPAL